MFQRNAVHPDEFIFVNDLMHLSIDAVEVEIVVENRLAVFELQGNDLSQPFGAVEVECLFAAQQVHGAQQAHKAQVVVAMQMAYEDVVDALCSYAEAFEL